MASTRLTRTPSVTGSQTTHTFSAWIKRASLSNYRFLSAYFGNLSRYTTYYFENDSLSVFSGNYTTGGSSSTSFHKISNAVFRDVSAWYHIVIAVDTTQATASDRVKIYVNNEQLTSFSTNTNPSLNDTNYFNVTTTTMEIGSYNNTNYFDGSMAHVHFIDGTAYSPSAFGETDATTGIWKPKTAPSVTYGTNGFFLKFENSGSMGTDSSGNANNFTVNGTLTQTVDTPSNVFATLNPLVNTSGSTLSNGNLSMANTASWKSRSGTLGVSQGKYYAEMKVTTAIGSGVMFGIISTQYVNTIASGHTGGLNIENTGIGYNAADGAYFVGNSANTYGDTFTNGDIIGIALDLDNHYVYFSKNGTFQNSGDPTSGSSGTGGISVPTGFEYTFSSANNNSSSSANFGNGYFGTTAVSSAQNPDDGIGIFEYDVPTGYRALCTKSINSQEYS